MKTADVRAVIVNYDGAHLLADCVESLRAQQGVSVEVVVVDNGSADDSALVAERLGVELRRLGRNRGLAVGYNEGARGATAPYLFCVNNDMRFAPDCVATLREAFRERPRLFAADPRHYSWDGARITHGALRLARDPSSPFAALPGVRPYEDCEVSVPTEVPWGCAGALLLDRRKFEGLGGFDPSFFLYSEDVDLCLRAWRRGWATVHIPAAVLYHRVSASHGPAVARAAPAGRRLRAWANHYRVKVSVPKNAQRVALKHLGGRDLVRQGGAWLRAWAAAAAQGRMGLPIAGATALLCNALDAARVLADRRRERREADVAVEELIRRFAG